jgi:catalase
MNKAQLSGRRERAVIAKENNFAQPGQRFRSWDNARQERFLGRMADILLDKRCTQVSGGYGVVFVVG